MSSKPALRLLRQPLTRCLRPSKPYHPRNASTLRASTEGPPHPRNPLDPLTTSRLEAARRAYYTRRSYYAGVGAAICMLVPLVLINFMDAEKLDAPSSSSPSFQGKPVVVAPGGEKLIAVDKKGGEEVEVVETGTSSRGNGEEEEYTLLGLGIRTVSFLSIQVYVVGFYVSTASLAALQARLIHHINPAASTLIPVEKEKLKQALLSPDESYDIWDAFGDGGRDGGVKSAWRVVPTRNTDFAHLRDGWVRGITARTQEAARKAQALAQPLVLGAQPGAALDRFDDDGFADAMKSFKALFGGRGKAPKGSVVLLTRDEKGKLGVLFQEKETQKMVNMGEVGDERIARLIWLGYLGGKNVSSEGARKGVVDGVMGLVERPVGTVETRVE
ncbi:Altered inheritance of mitochondria protein 18 mitochondrial [Coniosporium tulheliwenetii]|uniref:Altered inheritance of mitochondria protein 18 mitochondrial n=1 Tax=Coniosporium tulheliwenetii TaxID=3383036 RepID=A0ACC2YQI3_9PEZI|nr:Altered inheritance of mitochondria protein 18 mitochondrial [Cladosporium sp. JES 115]